MSALECLTTARPKELIHSSFSLAESAMKYLVSPRVLSSKPNARLMASSAPLTLRHLPTMISTRVCYEGVSCS